jgi:uncharacterized membrane protein
MSLITAIFVLAAHVAAWIVIYRVLNAAAERGVEQTLFELSLRTHAAMSRQEVSK